MARIAPSLPAAQAVERGRLLDVLDQGAKGPLTLVTGPPGAGKTLLLATWLTARERPGTTAWLSIERSDSRPARFWSAVLDSVEAAGEPGLTQLKERISGDPSEFVAAFGNAVEALPAPLVLVLDDFHELRAPEVSASVDTLLRHPPEKLHLVIASRADPQLSLHKLRVEGRLTDLRSAELAFTEEEAAELFSLAGVELTDEQLKTLHSRTEGWVAGLRLAALSLANTTDADELVRTFAGHERSVADYLVEEVLQRQPEQMREFMLKTSVADLMSADLADALTNGSDGAQLLDRLERSGAFVSPLDDQRGWYRYHPMFAELLRSELRHRMPDSYRLQHRRAARWHAQSGLHITASRHALAAGDWELAANLLSTGWLALLVRGEAVELADLIGELPTQLLAREPEVAIAAAGALLESGELERGQEYMRLADDQASTVKSSRRADFVLARTIASIYEARIRGEFDTLLASARKLLVGQGSAGLAIDPRDRRALALLNIGVGETWIGTPGDARSALEDSLALSRHAGRDYLVLCGLGPLALLEALTGSLRASARLAGEAVELAGRHGWLALPPCAAAHVALGICSYHWGSLAEASRHIDRAGVAARASGERAVLVLTEVMRAQLAARGGNLDGAERILRAARREADGWAMPRSLVVTLAWAEGKVLAAEGKEAEAGDVIEGAKELGRWAELELVKARLALADGDPDAAAALMAPALDGAVTILHPSTAIELHALAAVAEHQRGDDETALELVEQALRLAEPEGEREVLLEVGAPLRELLARRIRGGTSHRALAGDLVDALDPESTRNGDEGALLLDPLSDREQAVLRYLPTVMSKAEIAAEMFVSVNTVKTHMKSIYRKLDVTSRAEAVRRARSLHLV
ncbi:MAG TPA: LuxR C-terminal-related transcriptional regulator [Thermoleophilaceae bacterium]